MLTLLNSLPKIALAPLFLIWLGYGFVRQRHHRGARRVLPGVINTTTGLDAVDEDLLDLVRYLHASKLQVFLKIRIPNVPSLRRFRIQDQLDAVRRRRTIVGEFVASDRGSGICSRTRRR